jgi:hypothetical protein
MDGKELKPKVFIVPVLRPILLGWRIRRSKRLGDTW